MIKTSLCGLTVDEIFNLFDSPVGNYTHALKVANSIYKKRTNDISAIEGIPNKLKEELSGKAFSGLNYPVTSQLSVDKTVKYLFRTEEGNFFETVYMPDNKRNTVCVSTQSGCRMGCPFCVTASYGFRGNLSAGEIVNQVISIPDSGKVTHVVFMGMGEPMDNLENVLKACAIITSEWGLAISPRNVTVSTVGIAEGIRKFLSASACNLTLSLHSPFPEERKNIIPVEKLNPVKEILDQLKNFPLKRKRRISLAYVMISKLNDTDSHLNELKALLKGSDIRVNLLPYHQVKNDINESSSEERMQYFKHNLIVSGISASIRKSRGIDISAACGLLATGLK